jgi:hypothetical protein
MVFFISPRDKGQVMSVFMASVTQVGMLSQHLSCASEVLGACASDA